MTSFQMENYIVLSIEQYFSDFYSSPSPLLPQNVKQWVRYQESSCWEWSHKDQISAKPTAEKKLLIFLKMCFYWF